MIKKEYVCRWPNLSSLPYQTFSRRWLWTTTSIAHLSGLSLLLTRWSFFVLSTVPLSSSLLLCSVVYSQMTLRMKYPVPLFFYGKSCFCALPYEFLGELQSIINIEVQRILSHERWMMSQSLLRYGHFLRQVFRHNLELKGLTFLTLILAQNTLFWQSLY